MNVDILDSNFVGQFEKILLKIIRTDCRQVTFEEYLRKKTLLSQFAGWLSYQMIRLFMRLMSQKTTRKKKTN
jgi:hypothetical protein